ncbi:hypothetical protein RI367_002533 [Sorochytrium milnesiophthora]
MRSSSSSSSSSSSRTSASATKPTVTTLSDIETQLSAALSQSRNAPRDQRSSIAARIEDLRQQYRDACQRVLAAWHPSAIVQAAIEEKYWRLAFYGRFQDLRQLIRAQTQNATSIRLQQHQLRDLLVRHLDASRQFYEQLVERLRDAYHLQLDQSTGLLALFKDRFEVSSEQEAAVTAIHRSLVYLGDIARYRISEVSAADDATSAAWRAVAGHYYAAMSIMPSNGRSFAQLAMLSNIRQNRLDAVYWYCRSLATQFPSSAARDNLAAIHKEHTQERQAGKACEQTFLDFHVALLSSDTSPYDMRSRFLSVTSSPNFAKLDAATRTKMIITCICTFPLLPPSVQESAGSENVRHIYLLALMLFFCSQAVKSESAKRPVQHPLVASLLSAWALSQPDLLRRVWTAANDRRLASLVRTRSTDQVTDEASSLQPLQQSLLLPLLRMIVGLMHAFVADGASTTGEAPSLCPCLPEDLDYMSIASLWQFYGDQSTFTLLTNVDASVPDQSLPELVKQLRAQSQQEQQGGKVHEVDVARQIRARHALDVLQELGQDKASMPQPGSPHKTNSADRLMKALATERMRDKVATLERMTIGTGPSQPQLNNSPFIVSVELLLNKQSLSAVQGWITDRRVLVVVPLAVIDELDQYKKTSGSTRQAIRFFDQCLRSNKPAPLLRLQQPHERAPESALGAVLASARSDHYLIEVVLCALHLKQQHGSVVVVSENSELAAACTQLDMQCMDLAAAKTALSPSTSS